MHTEVVRRRSSPGFTLVELLVVIAIIGVLVALLLPAVQAAREAARLSQCTNNLKQLNLMMQLYHDGKGAFPTGSNRKGGVRYMMGWTVLTMPYIEQQNVRTTIDGFTRDAIYVSQPRRLTNPPHYGDHAIFATSPPSYICPSSELGHLSPDSTLNPPPEVRAAEQGALHYRANAGSPLAHYTTTSEDIWVKGTWSRHSWYTRSGVVYPESKVAVSDITDGTSNTIMFGETSSAIGRELVPNGWGGIQPWTFGYYYYGSAADDAAGWLMIDHKALTYPIGYAGSFYTNETPYTSAHASGGANVGFCDGSVRYFQPETSLDVLQQLATRSQDETVSAP